MKKIVTCALAFFACTSIFAAPANLIENPDFTAPDRDNGRYHGSWNGTPSSLFKEHYYHKIDKKELFQKGNSLKFETHGSSISVVQFLKNLKPNTKYKFSFSIKVKDAKSLQNGGGFFCQFYFGNKVAFPRPLLNGTKDWKRYTFEVTTPAKIAANPYLELRSWEAAGTAWFSDIELTEATK